MNQNAESIYIHIPFCKSKCPYCDFASWAGKEHLTERYIEALISEIRTKCEAYYEWSCHSHENGNPDCKESVNDWIPASAGMTSSIKTIFIGGGTPSLIAPEYYEKLFDELKRFFVMSKDCEITLELNPGTARDDYLEGYKKLGVNRISIGAQSFNEKILETLGRKHSVEETVDAIQKIKKAGFNNFNLDLIYSVPGITKEIWTDTIYKALEFKPKHISAYSLIIEPNTPFEHIYKDPKSLPSDDFAYELYIELCNILKKSKFTHYEISNFAQGGYESKHNLCYWLGKEYFAFGVSAHRYLNGLRTFNSRELEKYILSPNLEYIVDYPINCKFEKVMLNSRLNSGFDYSLLVNITSKGKQEMKNLLCELSKEGLLELSEGKIHLTDKGLFVNNEILLKLI